MKVPVIFCFLLACFPALAQLDETAPLENDSAPLGEKTNSPAPPLIIGRLAGEPVLTPPPPPRPQPPRLLIPASNTLSSKTYQAGDHTVTIQEVLPVELPPRPVPPPPLTAAQRQSFLATRALQPKLQFVCLSSTVYDHWATHITWRDNEGKHVFEAWSNVDFEFLRGVTNIRQGDTTRIYFHLGIGSVDTEKMATRYARFNKPYQKPSIPELPTSPETEPTFIVTKGDPSPEDLEKIQILHDLYKTEHARLKTAAEYTRTQNALRAAELAANPPKAPDIIVKRWSLSNQKTIPSLTVSPPESSSVKSDVSETEITGGAQ